MERFVVVHSGDVKGSKYSENTEILKDTVTGVLYIFIESRYGGGLTPLLDSNGKPIVDRM